MNTAATSGKAARRSIWIDLDNTPHVPFFKPIIEKLELRGYTVRITARDAFQVCELADRLGLRHEPIGRHYGKNKIRKILGLLYRASQMIPFVLRERPALAVSHGARSQIILSNLLRIPTVVLADYEFAQYPPLMRPAWEIVPEVIPDEALSCARGRGLKYPGIKEEVYVSGFRPDPAILSELGLSGGEMIVTVRPPATEAHYHNAESEGLFRAVMERLTARDEVRVILLPRNKKQENEIRAAWPAWFTDGRVRVPSKALDGLNLLWHSDLVVSGGGTMNREAAALGVPVYSIFRGRIGAVDHHLADSGRLVLLENVKDVEENLLIARRERPERFKGSGTETIDCILRHIEGLMKSRAEKNKSVLLCAPASLRESSSVRQIGT